MKGAFAVQEVVNQGTFGFGLLGTVASGQLSAGMEARSGAVIIIIRSLALPDGADISKRVRKGQKVILLPMQTVYELLKPLEGHVLEFEDIRTEPIKKTLVLNPDPTA